MFDRADPDTYADEELAVETPRYVKRYEIVLIVAGAVPIAANLVAHLTLLAARANLGRWPHRRGMDDPKGVPGIWFLWELSQLLVAVSIIALFVGGLMMMGLILLKAWPHLVRGGLIAVGLWLLGAMLFIVDPTEVWVWLFD